MRFHHVAAALLAFAALPAAAQDLSWAAFGTLGHARSNRDYHYLRNIDSGGTFDTDSVLGVQGDLRFSPQWSATVQLKAAQSLEKDARWDVTPAWAFVAWRPADDWLLRAGKMRVPLYLYSESLDVGVTYDFARLPVEMYSLVPSTDFIGASAAKAWTLGERELSLDAYAGRIGTTVRFWMRDGAPPRHAAGANFMNLKVDASGLVLTLRSATGMWRGGVHRVRTRMRSGDLFAVTYPFVEVAPGIGYYQGHPALPGPGVPMTSALRNLTWTIGTEQALAPGWRVAAEYAVNAQSRSELGAESRGGYVALLHTMGRFTPYVTAARLKSSEGTIAWAERLTTNVLPPVIAGADLINAAQRVAGETGYAADQRSVAIGSSYSMGPHQKIKFEWLHTRIGRLSRFVDTPPGSQTPKYTSIDTVSIAYSFNF